MNFAAAEVVDVGIPIAVVSFERIEMLVQCSAVEASQTVRIGGEVRWDPVENDADAGGVKRLDKTDQSLR